MQNTIYENENMMYGMFEVIEYDHLLLVNHLERKLYEDES